MKRIHPVVWGLMFSLVVAIITWFTFVGAMQELPFSTGQKILFYIHYPEVLANASLCHIFQPHSQGGHITIAVSVHCLYWLSIGALSGFIYARIMGKRSNQKHDIDA